MKLKNPHQKTSPSSPLKLYIFLKSYVPKIKTAIINETIKFFVKENMQQKTNVCGTNALKIIIEIIHCRKYTKLQLATLSTS